MDQSKAATLIQTVWRNYKKELYNQSMNSCKYCNSPHFTPYAYCEECREYMRNVEEENWNWRHGKGPMPKEVLHYCNDYECTGDCGELDCGCIDVCRGRCGLRPSRWD